AESAATIPVFTVSTDVDMSLITPLRDGARERPSDVPSLNDFVVKAAAGALREVPRFNAAYVDDKVECYSRVNVGIDVATEDALPSWQRQTRWQRASAQLRLGRTRRTGLNMSYTSRTPGWRLPALRTSRQSSVCGPRSRSCSATSSRWRYTASPTSRRSTGF